MKKKFKPPHKVRRERRADRARWSAIDAEHLRAARELDAQIGGLRASVAASLATMRAEDRARTEMSAINTDRLPVDELRDIAEGWARAAGCSLAVRGQFSQVYVALLPEAHRVLLSTALQLDDWLARNAGKASRDL